ncbi:MAG: amidase [Bacteroidota bacterium]
MTPLHRLGLLEMAEAIKAGKHSSQALTKACLDQIDKLNPTYHSMVIVRHQEAMADAKAADEAVARGERLGLLHGVPLTVKENFNLKGYKTTLNYPPLKDFVADHDAKIVQRLKSHGAIILGKTNVPTLVADIQTQGPLFPNACNPYDVTRITGGSTGGGAAAVASGMTPFEIGTDIGGSIRNPSHFCGVYGIKPSENTFPFGGKVPPFPNSKSTISMMSVMGPMTRSIEDLEFSFKLLVGPDHKEVNVPPIQWLEPKNKPLNQLKIGWSDKLAWIQAGKSYRRVFAEFRKKLEDQGVELIEAEPQIDFEKAINTFTHLYGALMGQDMSWTMQRLAKMKVATSKEWTGMARKIGNGIGLSLRQFSHLLYDRNVIIEQVQDFLHQFDGWLLPVGKGAAFPHCPKGSEIELDGEKVPYFDYVGMCFLANLVGNPVVMLPIGVEEQGLPLGIQITGPYWSEMRLLELARQFTPFVELPRPPVF